MLFLKASVIGLYLTPCSVVCHQLTCSWSLQIPIWRHLQVVKYLHCTWFSFSMCSSLVQFLEREQMYNYPVIGRCKSYFVKSHSKYNIKYKQDEIICSVWFPQTIGIPKGPAIRRFDSTHLWGKTSSKGFSKINIEK